MTSKIIFKKIRFINIDTKNFDKYIIKKGLFVFPAGPALASIQKSSQYYRSIKKADLVLGSYINREKKGRFRAFLSTTFNLIMCTIFDVYAFYLQGPAVWPIKHVKKIDISATGIAYASEVHIKLLYSGIKFVEITASKASLFIA